MQRKTIKRMETEKKAEHSNAFRKSKEWVTKFPCWVHHMRAARRLLTPHGGTKDWGR